MRKLRANCAAVGFSRTQWKKHGAKARCTSRVECAAELRLSADPFSTSSTYPQHVKQLERTLRED